MAQLKSTVVQGSLNVTDTIYMNGKTLVDLIYPAGSIYISVNNTNPEVLFPGTTWVTFGAGRTLVGLNSSDTDFDTAEETGGSKTKSLTDENIPAHQHTIPSMTSDTKGGHQHKGYARYENLGGSTTAGYLVGQGDHTFGTSNNIVQSDGSHNHTVGEGYVTGATGTGTAFNIMNPYITVYMWKRTA